MTTSSYAAGDDGGRVLELTCPWATQAMAENILASVSGFVTGRSVVPGPCWTRRRNWATPSPSTAYTHARNYGYQFRRAVPLRYFGARRRGGRPRVPLPKPQGRELRRKVSLEQKYYGTKISRREGLVIEKTDGDSVEARVVLNAEKLAFYDGSGQEQLYFDPAEGV